VLAERYRVIVMDSRADGRSTRDAKPYGYELMAFRRDRPAGFS
jgi:hypothetical protein